MKTCQIISLVLVSYALPFFQNASAGDFTSTTTNAPACLHFRDQFDAPQRLSFPATNITLLTIADKKGSQQIAGWVAPVKQRFGGRVDIRGIADVSSVPGPLRGLVRKRFQKNQKYPVMMDWSGDAMKAFAYVPAKANILVLNRRGEILQRFSGEANGQAIQDLCDVIDRAVADLQSQAPTQ